MVSLPAAKMAVAPPSHTFFFLQQEGCRYSNQDFLAFRADNKVEMWGVDWGRWVCTEQGNGGMGGPQRIPNASPRIEQIKDNAR